MAVFEIIEGQPGNGKSLYTARTVRKIIKRNRKWAEKTFNETGISVIRKVVSNLKFSLEFETECGEFLSYWNSVDEVSKLRDCDLVWDEIATEMDARTFTTLSDDVKRFLSQYDKRGIEIYANTQDFSMIDLRARMFVTRVATMLKVLGSSRPSPTKPPIKKIWGLILIRDLSDWKASDATKKTYNVIPTFFFIEKRDVDIYDTRQSIESTQLPVKKMRTQRYVADDGVKWKKYV